MLTIVFDLDGTLIDTAPDLIHTLNFILTEHGLPAVPYDDARPLIGGGARTMIERALALEGRNSSTAAVDELYTPSSPIMPNTSPTVRGRSPSLNRRSTAWPPRVIGWRSAPTSSNGSRNACWMRCG